MEKRSVAQSGKPAQTERLAYRQAEVARMLGVSATFISQLIAAGGIKAFREGRVVWVAASELDRFINERGAA